MKKKVKTTGTPDFLGSKKIRTISKEQNDGQKGRFVNSLVCVSHLLAVFLSFAWSNFFLLLLKNNGSIICTESNRAWLSIEFILTLMSASIGVFSFMVFFKSLKN